MISTEEAVSLILDNIYDWGSQTIHIDDCEGLILAEDIFSSRAMPPFDRVAMDGIAIHLKSYNNGLRTFISQGVQAAGQERKVMSDENSCLEVMTGAILPLNCDTVVQYEKTAKNDNAFTIIEDIKPLGNIHQKGKDSKVGDLIVNENTKILPSHISILASEGIEKVRVKKQPKIAIISTGDELVDIDKVPNTFQIRRSNDYMLASCLKKLNMDCDRYHIKDDLTALTSKVEHILSSYDVLIFSGGVSKGKFDFIPQALESNGVEKIFHKVTQRPGKPLYFGRKSKKFIFGLPGNPNSSLVCFKKYVELWLMSCWKQNQMISYLKLSSDIEFKPDLTYFASAKVMQKDQEKVLVYSKGNGSGDMMNLAQIDGYVELPKGNDNYKANAYYKFYPL